jgi:inositol transport system substrate-binding protein
MKKKVMILFLIVLMVLSTAVFAAGTKESTDGKHRVVYIARAQGDSFAAWLANAIKDEAKKYPTLTVDVQDGQANDDRVNTLLENAIINKYDLIILQANNGEAQTPYVERVVAAGIPIILTNPRIPGIAGTNSVDADPYEQGAVNARVALDQIPRNAVVVVLNGPAGNMHSTARRDAWQKEFFDKRPDVKIGGEQIANWNKDEAMKFMEDWVQSVPRIDAVISMNDNMAAGAIEVIKGNPKFANLLVYGVDGTAEAALLIKEGLMTTTSFQNAFELARLNMKIANDILSGTQVGLIDTDIDCPLITIDNVDKMLIDVYKATGDLK